MLSVDVAVLLFAQTDPLVPDSPLSWVQSLGVLGFALFAITAFLREWVVPGPTHRRELEARDARIAALEGENREMSLFMRDQMMPALTRTQDVVAKILEEQAWNERAQRRREANP